MQLGTKGTDAIISGTAQAPATFSLESSPFAFDILSSGIYSDKIRAVIRELSCNAKDAHVAAGCADRPFEVTLPTTWEPTFTIRDYGTGLKFIKGGCKDCHGTGTVNDNRCVKCNGEGNYDAVMRLFSTYFASDKTDSNEFIGALGLGSKSPFAYTKGYTVINRYNGVTYTYTAMVKLRLPTMVMMAHEETPDVPNGVEVSFPVDPRDIREFENKAGVVFEFFDPRPVLNKDIPIDSAIYSIRTGVWGMRQDGDSLRAIQGYVQYNVGNIDISRLSEAQQKLVSMPIDLFFNIGDLSVAASRETLQLDDRTIDAILTRLDIVQDGLMSEVKKQVDACRTPWEARLKIHALSMQSGIGSLVNDAFNKNMFFGDYAHFSLDSTKVVVNELDYNFVTLVQFTESERKSRNPPKTELFSKVGSVARTQAFRDVAANVSKKSDYDARIGVNDNVLFVVNDLNTRCDRYINYLLQKDLTNNFKRVYVITRTKNVPQSRAMDEAVNLLESVGNPPFEQASSLKAKYDPMMKVAKEATASKRERMEVRILASSVRYSRRGLGWKNQAWYKGDDHPELADPTVKKFYVKAEKGGDASGNGLYAKARDFADFVRNVRNLEIFPEFGPNSVVYGIRPGSKLLQDSSFVEFVPYLRAEMQKILTKDKEMELSLAVHPFTSDWRDTLKYIAEHPQVLAFDSPIRMFAMVLTRAMAADRSGHGTLVDMARRLGFEINNTADFNAAWVKVKNKYPLLKNFNQKYGRHDSMEAHTAIVDYLRWIDDQRKQRMVLTDVTVDVHVVETEEEETVNA